MRTKKSKRIARDELAAARDAIAAGRSVPEISSELNVDPQRLAQVLRKTGPGVRRIDSVAPAQLDHVQSLVTENGYTIHAAAEVYSIAVDWRYLQWTRQVGLNPDADALEGIEDLVWVGRKDFQHYTAHGLRLLDARLLEGLSRDRAGVLLGPDGETELFRSDLDADQLSRVGHVFFNALADRDDQIACVLATFNALQSVRQEPPADLEAARAKLNGDRVRHVNELLDDCEAPPDAVRRLSFWCVPPVLLEEHLFDHTHRKARGQLSGAPLGHREAKPIWLHRLPLRATKVLGKRFFPAHPDDERDKIIQTIWKAAGERLCRRDGSGDLLRPHQHRSQQARDRHAVEE